MRSIILLVVFSVSLVQSVQAQNLQPSGQIPPQKYIPLGPPRGEINYEDLEKGLNKVVKIGNMLLFLEAKPCGKKMVAMFIAMKTEMKGFRWKMKVKTALLEMS